MGSPKMRLDVLLVNKGFYESREKAKACIMAGQVLVGGRRADKAGSLVSSEAGVEVLGKQRYVSRGGLKLEKALQSFKIDLNGAVVLDVGASTGGFTDCALQNGASLVYAVDVGYGQLDWRLRNSPGVVVLERTNIRSLSGESLSVIPDFAVIDVSFISLAKVFPRITELTAPGARGVALIKPQFEAGREKVGKNGVVRDPQVHREVVLKACAALEELSWGILGLDYSPIKGPKGNIEFLAFFKKETASIPDLPQEAERAAREAAAVAFDRHNIWHNI
jgi:23S rRNA (cytidine1920-2'-O)/16S rRNA (cytidine1409-2'-O)-methyltransferase